MEREHGSRARHRIEVVDDDRLFSRRDICKRQWLVRRVERRRKALDVLLRLNLDASDRKACRFCLADSDGLAIEEEEVIDVSVAFVELELADGNGVVGGEVHFIAMLKHPSGRLELAINLGASLFFRCVGATGRRHRPLPLFCSAPHAWAHEITVREVAAQSANTAAFESQFLEMPQNVPVKESNA